MKKAGRDIMKTLTLKNKFQTNATLLPNDFIDNYMIDANGEFVKVYLFLLRHLDDPCSSLTLTTIADCLNNTEADILRAFRYWEKKGLLRTERDTDGKITALELQKMSLSGGGTASSSQTRTPSTAAPSSVSSAEPPSANASAAFSAAKAAKAVPIDSFRAQKEIKSLLFMHYIRKVAFSWVEEGIETVTQAKEQSALYNKNCYTVLNAFGIKNRGPASSELTYIKKWAEEYAFSPNIIEEACRRTIAATHQPSFEYADSILTKWHEKNIRHMKDITALDDEYQKERSAGRTAARSRAATRNLNNFERRSYDMESLEEQLLNSN